MAILVCPKCGRVQQNTVECLRCGLVFGRYRGGQSGRPVDAQRGPGLVRRAYRIACWVSLACAVPAMLLALHQAPPPVVDTAPDAAERARAKLTRFRTSARPGQLRILRMNEAELNGWIHSRLPRREAPSGRKSSGTSESLQDLRVQLLDKTLRAYAAFEFHGKEMTLQLEGTPRASNGRIRLEPSAGKLGALPLPAPATESAAVRILDTLQLGENRLPVEGVVDIRIERFELVITSR